jgi:endonuclease YncB( thermonuclease family)
MRWTFIVAVVLATVIPGLAHADITGPARVIDGDNIDIAGERIRLHGIDAPESAQTCVAGGATWPCGQSATAALVAFIGDAPVRCGEQGADRYGRTIATCYVQGEDIGAGMVLNGWAPAYRRYSTDYVVGPPAPQAIVPQRTDPACAMDGLQPDQPFPFTVPGLT